MTAGVVAAVVELFVLLLTDLLFEAVSVLVLAGLFLAAGAVGGFLVAVALFFLGGDTLVFAAALLFLVLPLDVSVGGAVVQMLPSATSFSNSVLLLPERPLVAFPALVADDDRRDISSWVN